MYIVSLTYTAPLSRIDALLAEHVRWLEAAYRDGLLLASGRKVPRDGGVILARAMPRAALDELIAADPFARAGVARYDIIEFTPTMTADALASLRDTPSSC